MNGRYRGKYYGNKGGKGQHSSLPSIAGVHLEAGSGGECSDCNHGGGGGGLVINGRGKRSQTGAAQGYGSGGGSPGGRNVTIGNSGVVILYI